MTTFRYLTAQLWGMRWARPPQREVLRDPECYIHHVGGSAWMDGDAAAIFRNLNEYAINVKGYSALDYDLLVHYDRTRDILTIGEGRGEWMSAATRNRNEEGEAIVVCGNLHLRDILPAEIEGAARAHVIGVERGWIARDAQILGHRDNPAHPGATSCPGQYGYAALPAIRQRVAELLAPPPPPPPPEPDPPPDHITSEDLMIVAKTTDGGHYASFGYQTGALHIGTRITEGGAFASGVALDASAGWPLRRVPHGSWAASKPSVTKAQAFTILGNPI